MSLFKKDPYFEPVNPKWKDAKIFLPAILGLLFFFTLYLLISAAFKDQPVVDVPPVVTVDELASPASLPQGSVAYINSSGCQLVWMAPRAEETAGNFTHCDNVVWNEAREISVDENIDAGAIQLRWNEFAPNAVQ